MFSAQRIKMSFKPLCRLAVLTAVLFAAEMSAFAMDYADVRLQNSKQNIEGRFLDAIDLEGRRMFETRDRQFFFIDSQKLIKTHSDKEPFAYYTQKETLARLQKEFPESKGYYILDKQHFLVVYTTSRAFANWYGRLLEKLYTGYVAYWKREGIDLEAAKYPLVAVVMSSQDSYLAYAENEGVKIPASVCAYYNQRTNRVVMYDMSGREKSNEGDRRRAKAKDIEVFLQQPGSYFNVATVVHEAAHQVGFNSGMHTRLAPNPVWVCEGLATFHEVPDAKDSIGWSLGPRLNPERLVILKEIFKDKDRHPFEAVVVNDGLFMNEKTALTAYAAAWGLIYYLANKKTDELAEYMNMLRKKTPETEDSPKIRLREFEQCFGNDWDKLYKDAGAFYLKAVRDEERKAKMQRQ
ncbi:MAG: DUF1570 domain-containing protein [Planctomycetaceae bacterium]|jgi:hypothetical protein|nr:DUF1570 domain-containing protein [Planctomycetaceae bacterium]